jgi:DNA invertase Pin-like site-specific DNA recombinase
VAFARQGDTLVVTKVDRLARSTIGLWDIVKELDGKGVALRVLNLGGETVDTQSATGRLILNIFSGVAQFEQEMMLERQKEGIAKAKAEGVCKGRKPTARAKAEEVRKMHAEGRTPTEIAKALGISAGGASTGPSRMPGLRRSPFWAAEPHGSLGAARCLVFWHPQIHCTLMS